MKKKTPLENKLSSNSLFVIEKLLKRECDYLDVFRFQVGMVMDGIKTDEGLKVFANIDKKRMELDKACREIHSVFEGQFERKSS